MSTIQELLKKTSQGDRRSLSKLLSMASTLSDDEVKYLWETFLSKKKKPKLMGLIGTPGAGKSTFLNLLLDEADIRR